MSDTLVTFQGWIGTELEERYVGTHPVVSFRVASTPRRYRKENNGFVDLETNWYTVNAWRHLAVNAMASLQKGDAVVVYGRQTTQVFTDSSGRVIQSVVVEATSFGHDLSRGTSTFAKNVREGGNPDDDSVKGMNANLGVDGPQVSSDGDQIEDLVDTSTGEILDEPAA